MMTRLQDIQKSLRTAIEEVMKKSDVVLSSRSPRICELKELHLNLELMRQDLKKIDRQIHDTIPLEDLESDVESCENFDCDILRLASDLQLLLAEFENRPLCTLAQLTQSSVTRSKPSLTYSQGETITVDDTGEKTVSSRNSATNGQNGLSYEAVITTGSNNEAMEPAASEQKAIETFPRNSAESTVLGLGKMSFSVVGALKAFPAVLLLELTTDPTPLRQNRQTGVTKTKGRNKGKIEVHERENAQMLLKMTYGNHY